MKTFFNMLGRVLALLSRSYLQLPHFPATSEIPILSVGLAFAPCQRKATLFDRGELLVPVAGERCVLKVEVEESLLRRLKSQGLICSHWPHARLTAIALYL